MTIFNRGRPQFNRGRTQPPLFPGLFDRVANLEGSSPAALALWALLVLALGPAPLPAQDEGGVRPGDAVVLPHPEAWRAAAADTTHTLPLVVPRVAPGVVEDGRIPDRIWEGIPLLPMFQHVPDNGDSPSERTEIRIVHDGRSIYFQARMYDREPELIQAPSLRRNQIPHTNDFFGILLDSFLDRETAHGFWTNPAGLRTDLLTQNDASGSGAFNYDYNAFWEVAPEWNDEGWFTEVRIPFSALRFEPVDGEVTMGLIVYRRIPRRNEWSTFPHIPQLWGGTSHFRPSAARPVVFQGVERSRLFLVTPYVLGGVERTHFAVETGEGGNGEGAAGAGAWTHLDRRELEAGVDLKVGVTPNLTLDVTVNPDFAQVEADDQQVNLSRFSLFFPEKRRFFQERSSALDFSFGGSDRLFYSRRIGIADGEPARILAGARIAGRVGAWDVGGLNVQTAEAGNQAPGANHGVVRLKRTVLNPNSQAGVMVTSRVSRDGGRALAYGLDTSLRIAEADYLILQWAQTYDSDEEGVGVGFLDRAIGRASLERRSNRGLLFDLDLRRVGSRFDPDLGFIRQRDYIRVGDQIGYGWTPGPDAFYQSQTLQLRASALRRLEDGVVESAQLGPRWSLSTRGGYRIGLNATAQREDLERGFGLPGGNRVEAGRYTFWNVGASVGTPGGELRGISLNVDGGTFYDGSSLGFSASPRLNLASHLELRGRYGYDRLRFPDRDGALEAHVARLRLDHQISTSTSWAAFVQYNSVTDAVIGNLRFVFTPREGSDLYVVYNTSGNADRQSLDPAAPFLDSQTLLIKLSVTRGY